MNTITIIYMVMFFFGIYFLTLFLLLYARNYRDLFNFPTPQKFPSITFLIPAYNEEDSIKETLKSLLEVNYPKEKKQIIVINDGSIDNTKQIVQKFVKKYSFIKLINKSNSGKANSLNYALKKVKTELIAVTDADSYPSKDSLMKMVGFFEQDKKIAAVTSRVLVKNKKRFLEKFQDFDYVVIAWTRKLLDYVDSVYVTNGPLSIYRMSAVKEIGGFDPKNLTEDIEITWHLLSKGYKTKMAYSALVYTTVPQKLRDWINQRIRWNLGGLQTINKYKTFALRKNIFGYFVITYVSLAFFLSLVGLALFLRFLWINSSLYLFSLPYFFQGYNPFEIFDFYIPFTLLLIMGLSFLALSFIYYRKAVKNAKLKKKNVLTILTYTFIYRPLYLIPLLGAIYRLIKGDLGWYTK